MTAVFDTADSRCVDRIVVSPNIEPRVGGRRPDLLLLHYTGMENAAKAIDWLSRPESKVSCHYVVAEDGAVTQMVPEALRAWHAGLSHWAGETDINSCSIGIEIQNPGHALGYPPFPPRQMRAIEALSADIVGRHAIPPGRVLAHSDVAPARKIDPGEAFDWQRLARAGVGRWVEPEPADAADPGLALGARSEMVAEAQWLMRRYGYGAEVTGFLDQPTAFIVRAVQLHWRPARVDCRLDRSTLETLRRLVAMAEGAEAIV
ncbi:MAG: N-acetylmuramoyl-L-alanine amidase [Hyphomicrobiaceae bacterium]|nr:N-acetylmuramoyl-L-alanine amidase [Hyphomicrobiaceae bacterium]